MWLSHRPENRQQPDGRTVRLFVVRQRPPEVVASDPVLVIEELGWSRLWSQRDSLPSRVRREAIQFEARGTGRSEPSLACTEIEAAAPALYGGAPAGDAFPASALEPVQKCHDRLIGEGIDLSAYGLEEIAADAEDLRKALGVEKWNLRSKGAGSRIAWEIMREHPESVRAAWFDSPETPATDFLRTGIIGMRDSMTELKAACASDAACHATYPDPDDLLAKSLADYGIAHATYDGKLIPLTNDPTSATLAVRFTLAAAPQVILPALAAIATGNFVDDPQDWYTQMPPFTVGYGMDQWDINDSSRSQVFSDGARFSSICRDQMPFADTAAIEDEAGGSDMYVQAFARSPYPQICEVWDVGAADPAMHEPVSSDIPSLLLVGQYDTFGVPSLVADAAKSLPASQMVEFQGFGHNVLALDCALGIRNAWLDDPAQSGIHELRGRLARATY